MPVRVGCSEDAVVDLLPEMPDRLMQRPGRVPARVTVDIAYPEGKSGFTGRTGSDLFSRFMRQTLSEEKIDTCL